MERLKIIFTKDYEESTLHKYVESIKHINNLNISNLIPFKSLDVSEKCLILSRHNFEISLDTIDTVEYFKEIGSFDIIMTICNIIKQLHLMNVIHGNLKLSNILLGNNSPSDDFINDYYICDYSENILLENQNTISMKSVLYYSPEILLNKEFGFKEADIWSIGIIIYKIISGKFPFIGNNLIELLNNIKDMKYNALEVEFADILNKLLIKIFQFDITSRLTIEGLISELESITSVEYLPQESSEVPELELPPPLPTNTILLKNKIIKSSLTSKADDINEKSKNIEIYFIDSYKDSSLQILDNGSTVKQIKDSNFNHCYLNIQIESGIYHIKYMILGDNGTFLFGFTKDYNYDGKSLHQEKSSCCIAYGSNGGYLCGGNGNKVCKVNRRPKNKNKYEIIVNMKNKTVSVVYEDGKEELYFNNISGPLYPFVIPYYEGDSIGIVGCWISK